MVFKVLDLGLNHNPNFTSHITLAMLERVGKIPGPQLLPSK